MGGKSDLVQNTGRRVTAQRKRAAGFGSTFEARLRVERSVPWLTILQPRPRVTSCTHLCPFVCDPRAL